jgi:hypothetical protein
MNSIDSIVGMVATEAHEEGVPQEKPLLQPRQLQHDTGSRGGEPCRRCGMSYSPRTAYIPCFVEGDTLATWLARNAEALGSAEPETSERAP